MTYIIEPPHKLNGFFISQNYPNPFNPNTKIEYSVQEPSKVTIKVFDLLGREIATLVDEEKSAGNYKVEFKGVGLPSGIYFYRMETRGFSEVKKLVLVK
ncbi:MAG: T9SS type A sorting domain-containing protein [Ignavibacteria bacterium]